MQDYAIEFAENTYSCVKLIELLRNVIYLYTPLVAALEDNATYSSPHNDNLLI